MKHLTLLFLLFFSYHLSAQGWVWQSGDVDQTEDLGLVWADTDSTVVSVGDSAGLIVWKQLDHHGQLLASKQVNTITTEGFYPVFSKKDFGFSYVNKVINSTGWTTFNSLSYYQLNDPVGNVITGGVIFGHNGNDYTLNDALLTPDSTVLMVGVHLNPDENKLYLQKAHFNNQSVWIKDLHDSTKRMVGLRIYPVSGNRYVVLATRQGYIGGIYISQTGFLLLNDTGDLLESNWIPDSGIFDGYATAEDIPVAQDADGFTLLKNDRQQLYRFDPLGHLLWTKKVVLYYSPVGLHRTNSGYIICGYRNANLEYDLAVTSLDQDGNLIWDRTHDLQHLERWNDIVPLDEGGYIAVGSIGSDTPGASYNWDYLAARINPDGSIFNNLVAGYAFADLNANCLPDSSEPGFGGLNVYFDNNYFRFTALTGQGGHFELASDTGSYVLQLSQPPGAYWTACTDNLTGYLPDFYTTDTVYFPFRPTVLCPQMRIDLEANQIRPCSNTVAYLRWQNIGTQQADSASVILTLPSNAQFISAQLPVTDLGNGQYRITIGPVAVGASGQTSVTIQGGCGLQIGDFLCLQAHIYPAAICATPEPPDSSAFQFAQERCLEVRNSFDPNDKTAEPIGRGAFQYISADTTLTYLIRFQNTGNDTAFLVIIRDTLSPQLDPFSVRPEIASHPFRMEFQEDGSLKFIFENILLPDSATNEAASHGFLRFKVNMRPGLLPNATILNRAAIYFDHNAPVLTNTVLRTIQPLISATVLPANTLPLVEISPNPAHSVFALRLLLDRAAEVQIAVYDVAGRLVSQLLPVNRLSAGEHSFSIPAEAWREGVYFLEVRSGEGRVVRKLVKL